MKNGKNDAARDIQGDPIVRAGQIVDSLSVALLDTEAGLEGVPPLMATVLRDELWKERRLRTGKIARHDRFIDFITVPPLEGLGENPEAIKKLLRDDTTTLAAFEAACVGKVGRPPKEKSDNGTNLKSDRGNTKAYTLRRLAKDHPKIFERVTRGELSANQGAIAAGFRKAPDPLTIAKRAFAKLTARGRKQFDDWRGRLEVKR
jgi:hypothetical protein